MIARAFNIILIFCLCSSAISISGYQSSSPSLSLYDEYQDSLFSDKKNGQSLTPSLQSWKVAKTSIQIMSYGSLMFVGFSLAKRLLIRTTEPSSSRMYVPYRESNETSAAVTELKAEVSELWSAILNIHNKQNEFRELLSTLDDKVTASTDNKVTSNDDSQTGLLEDELVELKSRFESIRGSISLIESKFSSQFAKDEKLTQAVRNLSDNTDTLTTRLKALEQNFKLLEESILKKMRQFFAACKEMVVSAVRVSTAEQDDDDKNDDGIPPSS